MGSLRGNNSIRKCFKGGSPNKHLKCVKGKKKEVCLKIATAFYT